MKLVDYTPEQLMDVLIERGEALHTNEQGEADAKAQWEQLEAKGVLAIKDAMGCSMSEAERRWKAKDERVEAFIAYQHMVVRCATSKRDYRRAELAVDIWRTEQSTIRAMS